ncbi:MAG: hypothetical protein PVF58_08900 [Candidatus Methanofastidiosia archaeon]
MDLKIKKNKNLILILGFTFVLILVTVTIQAQSEPKGTAKIYGYASYSIGTKDIPIKHARVNLYEDYSGMEIGTTTTNTDGYYEFYVTLLGSKDVYARIYCESMAARVTYGTSGSVYSYRTPTQTAFEGFTTFLGEYQATDKDLHWWAMDNAIDEYNWLDARVNWTRSQVEIRYPTGDWPKTDGNVIYLPDRDTANWDRPTVLHEYAHCVMYALYNGFPAGGCTDACQCGDHHELNSVADSGFAFKEGWADFMQSVIDDEPSYTYLHELGDVDGDGTPNSLATNIEDNGYTVQKGGTVYRCKWYHGRCMYKPYSIDYPSFNHNGCLVEGAVAGILWDIVDSKNDDDDDPLQKDFQWIWNVIYFHKPQNMMQFLDHWNGGSKNELCTVCRDHGISMVKDIETVFDHNTYFIAGDTAYCTDVLGSAKYSFGLAKGGVLENPEGRTEVIATLAEEYSGNLIMVGGPAVSPLAKEYSRRLSIGYYYNPGSSFEIIYHHKSVYLDLSPYPGSPKEDICIVFLGEENSRSSMVVWGYEWQGTYAGCAFIADLNNRYTYHNANMLMLRWIDQNYDELVQLHEVFVEDYETVGVSQVTPEVVEPVVPEKSEITSLYNLGSLFYNNTYFGAGDTAYCTDVLGSAKIAFGLAKGGVYENPEGRTETIIQQIEHDTGNLILVGGPAVSPLADEFDNIFGITYEYYPGESFTIYCEGKYICLNLDVYPYHDVCIVYIGQQNGRNVMVVWGYGWEGTYAGSAFIGDFNNWYSYPNAHLLLLRWVDTNGDGLVQPGEYYVESWA